MSEQITFIGNDVRTKQTPVNRLTASYSMPVEYTVRFTALLYIMIMLGKTFVVSGF